LSYAGSPTRRWSYGDVTGSFDQTTSTRLRRVGGTRERSRAIHPGIEPRQNVP
jgi:hypothetical protein